MSCGEEERAENDGSTKRYPAVQPWKDETPEKNLLTERRDKNGCDKCRVCAKWSIFTLFKNELIVGLQMQVQDGNYVLVEDVYAKNCE